MNSELSSVNGYCLRLMVYFDMNVNLHIERLILEGVTLSLQERTLLGASLEAELTRLITNGGLPATFPNSGAVSSVPAGGVQTNNNPIQLGQQIAQAVYGGNGR